MLSLALVLALASLIALSPVHILIPAASRTLGALRLAAALRRLLRPARGLLVRLPAVVALSRVLILISHVLSFGRCRPQLTEQAACPCFGISVEAMR